MTRIKICGITRVDDAQAAAALGVDLIGLNFVPDSPRVVSLEQARTIATNVKQKVGVVGVFVNEPAESLRAKATAVGLETIQLHGDEPAEWVAALAPFPVLKAFRWRGPETLEAIEGFLEACRKCGRLPAGLLLDSYRPGQAGGTGETWDWAEATVAWDLPWYLAGGLRPENVAQAVARLRPTGVDVAGGVEQAPGVKDHGLLTRFVAAVRNAQGSNRAATTDVDGRP